MSRFLGEITVSVDGKEIVLRADLNAMCIFQEETGFDALSAMEELESGNVDFLKMRSLTRACMVRHQPDATVQDAGDVISSDLDVLARLFAAASPSEGEVEGLGKRTKRAPPD